MKLKFSKKQSEYLKKATHTFNIKSGAVRSGKTFLDTEHLIPLRIRQLRNEDGLIMIIGVTEATIERNILRPMRDKFGSELVGTIGKNKVKLFGEWCYALGAEKVSQVSKLQGTGIKYAYGDEVAKWNEDFFNMLISRLDKEYSIFDGTCNPEHKNHWFKKFIDSDGDIYHQHYVIDDNPFLHKQVVDNLKRAYKGTVLYDRYILGLWVNAEGLIYKQFADNPERYKHKGDIPSGETVIGIDYGGTKSGQAFVCTRIANDYSKVVVMASKKITDLLDDKQLLEAQLEFIDYCRKKFKTEIDYIYPDNADPTHIRGLDNAVSKLYPNTVVRGCWKQPINDRITATQKMLAFDMLSYIEYETDTFVEALSEALWDSKKQEDVRLDDFTSDIDTLDAFEYAFERDIKGIIDTMEGGYERPMEKNSRVVQSKIYNH